MHGFFAALRAANSTQKLPLKSPDLTLPKLPPRWSRILYLFSLAKSLEFTFSPIFCCFLNFGMRMLPPTRTSTFPVITTALHVQDELVERWTEGRFLLRSTQKVCLLVAGESVAHSGRKSSCASWNRYLLQPLKTNELRGLVVAGTQMADP